MPGRHANTADYRYGFAGMELDNEIKGEGNSYDFGARMYDSRVGRWFVADPLEIQYPMYSPYSYAANSPMVVMDSDGESIIFWLLKMSGITSKESAIKVIDAWGIKDQETRNFILFTAGMASGAVDMNIIDVGKALITEGNTIAQAYNAIDKLAELDWDEAKLGDFLKVINEASPVKGIIEPFTELYKDFTEEGRDIDFFESGKNTFIAGTTIVTTAEGMSSILTKPKIKISTKAEILRENVKKGADFEKSVLTEKAKDQINLVEQITIKTKSGTKTRIDIVGRDKVTGKVKLTEAKSSETAPLTKAQKTAFPEIKESGGTVTGKGKGDFVGGTEIPPTEVDVVRPSE